jgi:hypothetical protein
MCIRNYIMLLLFLLPFKSTKGQTTASAGAVFASLDIEATEVVYNPLVQVESMAIPFRVVHNLIIIEAEVDGQAGNFVFDTGTPYLVLNQTYFRDYPNKKSAQKTTGITGIMREKTTIVVGDLNIRQLKFRNILADMLPLGHIENVRGIKILGLIGLNLFRQFEIVVDIPKSVIFLYALDKKGNYLGSGPTPFTPTNTGTYQLLNAINIIAIEGQCGGKKLKLCIDTAAEYSVIHSGSGKTIMRQVQIEKRTSLIGADGGKAEVMMGRLKSLWLGNRQIEDLKVIIVNLDQMAKGFDYPVDGMLGFDFLKRGKLRINMIKKVLQIEYLKAQ